MINASDALDVALAVRELGYKAILEKDSVGDPMISSKMSGLNFVILFYGCTDHLNCQSLQFSSSFDLTEGSSAAAMNEWNVANRYGRAYVDEDNDPIIRYEFNMRGAGISTEVFEDNFAIWDSLPSDFKDHIEWST